MSHDLVRFENVCKYFTVRSNWAGKPISVLKAVDNLSINIRQNEAFGLVGESGCGKTTLGKLLVGLHGQTSGKIFFEDTELTALSKKQRRAYCKNIQLIFQDPYASLNPRMTIGDTIAEPIWVNQLMSANDVENRVNYLLDCVGLSNHQRNRYPHEFSGGQRQRVGIARALAIQPKLIVCDEPVSALDVSIQAQVLNLLRDIKAEFGLTYLFIAHGLNVVKYISDRIGVMYLGQIVEVAPGEELYNNPLHPYTRALLSSIPRIDPRCKTQRIVLQGDVGSPIDPPNGCRFAPRCYKKVEGCESYQSNLHEISPEHLIACKLFA